MWWKCTYTLWARNSLFAPLFGWLYIASNKIQCAVESSQRIGQTASLLSFPFLSPLFFFLIFRPSLAKEAKYESHSRVSKFYPSSHACMHACMHISGQIHSLKFRLLSCMYYIMKTKKLKDPDKIVVLLFYHSPAPSYYQHWTIDRAGTVFRTYLISTHPHIRINIQIRDRFDIQLEAHSTSSTKFLHTRLPNLTRNSLHYTDVWSYDPLGPN